MNWEESVYVWIGLAVILLPIQLFYTAPYGRHLHKSWGPLMDNKWGWVLMELVSPIFLLLFFFKAGSNNGVFNILLIGIYMLHYLNRSLVYPFRLKAKSKKIPIAIVASAVFFNVINGSFNGYFIGKQIYDVTWLSDPRFVIGTLVFVCGVYINIKSDNILLHLRKLGETGYKIPKGFLFEKISCPNHFGEILEWTGFALMAWNPAAWSFAIWTIANLLPRALSHHRWYRSSFEQYPKTRKAVFPYIL